MIINTGNVIYTSSNLLNQVKDNDSTQKITSIDEPRKKISNKLITDLTETNYSDNSMKSKFVAINNNLTQFEEKQSELQFAEQKINELENISGKLNKNQIAEFINNNKYNDQKILALYFPTVDDFSEYVIEAKAKIQTELKELDKNFKQIEITSQNLISLYSQKSDVIDNGSYIKNMNESVNYTNLDKKRVLELIS